MVCLRGIAANDPVAGRPLTDAIILLGPSMTALKLNQFLSLVGLDLSSSAHDLAGESPERAGVADLAEVGRVRPGADGDGRPLCFVPSSDLFDVGLPDRVETKICAEHAVPLMGARVGVNEVEGAQHAADPLGLCPPRYFIGEGLAVVLAD